VYMCVHIIHCNNNHYHFIVCMFECVYNMVRTLFLISIYHFVQSGLASEYYLTCTMYNYVHVQCIFEF